ncbi:NAD-dependent epimerase/dehydratase family protein [Aeromicrobium duanguangcaii]|uniref:NAD-dependent epimerase/dehydratase family protein n=1 Tax=Aeromicrobium duanguangcaii TaxID=2968086 RepID=A0ABY5KDH1_9ACTN|nr:NAD-dependent epimerase/dehydratase family protein [Aeromicrobium duanguangcaii]MCD9152886.1 NAD-dependent epimerase/dehydratase family protein [Aeromicrobium duanguangcaii]UUI67135.1 NAD-dependent epimerase/dehydratase family protein [Aeromicrobium duanguangcaii]
MKVLVLGGDGFCGWPSALSLSHAGHEVAILDNLVRRRMDEELGVQSLTPIASLPERLDCWEDKTGRRIVHHDIDLAHDYPALLEVFQSWRPDAIVHFAEQRSAPYSMKDSAHKRYTVDNNVNGTHNVLAGLVEAKLDAHLVHLGTTGVYGYESSPIDIPEGYLTVSYPDRLGATVTRDILYPTKPGSVYHMTKSIDQLLFQFYAQYDNLRITDLHQGIVWGTQTDETRLDERLINRFDYDGDFGTVLNRFLMQAAIGYPLTVHGTGGQTRAFIHVQDTATCVRLAVESGGTVHGQVRIMNQLAQTLRVIDLARLIERELGATVEFLPNPRDESAENDLDMVNDNLRNLGFDPILLEEGLFEESVGIAARYADRCDRSKIRATSYWNEERRAAVEAES